MKNSTWKSSALLPDPGLEPMPNALPVKSTHLWDRVLDILRTRINPQTFNTWFPPIVFDGCDDTTCALTVPNAFFQV